MDQTRLSKLIKLAKLANHNPNDQEANLAARAVAKLLSDNNYKWIEDAQKNGGTPPGSSFSQDDGTSEIVIRISQREYQNNSLLRQLVDALRRFISRNPEPPPRYKPYEGGRRAGGYYNPFTSDFGENTGFDWQKFYEERKRAEEYERVREQAKQYKQKKAYKWTAPDDFYSNPRERKVYTQTCRDCSVCGITRLTTDEDNPYICYDCRKKT